MLTLLLPLLFGRCAYDPRVDVACFDALISRLAEQGNKNYLLSPLDISRIEQFVDRQAFTSQENLEAFLALLARRDRAWPDAPILTLIVLRKGIEAHKTIYRDMTIKIPSARGTYFCDSHNKPYTPIWKWSHRKIVLNSKSLRYVSPMRGRLSMEDVVSATTEFLPLLKYHGPRG